MTANNQTEKKEGLTIVRHFNAPKQVVFDAFANAEAMGEWWGPAGMDLTVKTFEFKPGGNFTTRWKLTDKACGVFLNTLPLKAPN